MPSRPTLSIDVKLYQHYLDDFDMTEAQKKELLEMLWSIVCEFVLLGFDVHPVQQAQQNSAKEMLLTTQTDSSSSEFGNQGLIEAFVAASNSQGASTKTQGEEVNANL